MAEAARKGHKQTCPSHEGGSIVAGSAGFLINGQPAARILDRAGCVGAADLIAEGTPSLLIDGLPAVRRGDAMSHEGGLVIEGSPDVLVGGEAVTIRVEGDEAFMADVQRTMAKLLATRSGQEWMRRMAATGRTVTIVRSEDGDNHSGRENVPDSMNGVGTDSTIRWNPEADP